MIIIIPARNEEKRIKGTLEKYLSFFPEARFVVAMSKCVDDTEGVVRTLSEKTPGRIVWIHSTAVRGNSKGKAVREGMKYALDNYQDDLIGFIDADNSVTPQEFSKLVDAMPEVEVAISSRYLPDSYLKERDSLWRIIASRFYRRLVSWLFSLPWQDTQCGGKLYRRRVLVELLPRLRVNDMTFDVEMLFWLCKLGRNVVEVPIFWRENTASTISTSKYKFFSTSWQMFWSLLKMRWRFWWK